MSPLFMEADGYELNSPGSESAGSNTPGSEREGEPMKKRGRKRQQKNRDAARKSRRKQTERADELHEELQNLEQSNSALKKEIAALKKNVQLYTTALERHEPFCCLKASDSPSADSQAGPSPPAVPLRASGSLSTSLTSLTSSLQTSDSVESAHPSSSTPPNRTAQLASPMGSSTKLFHSSSSVTTPYSVSFSAASAPHSLFSKDPSTNVRPVCRSLVSNPVPSSSLSAQGTIHAMSANASFSTLDSGALDAFLSNTVPPYSNSMSENAGLVAQTCPMNVPQLHPGQFGRNPLDSSPPCSLLPPNLQDPAAFALRPSYSRQVNPVSLLSRLTVPSPLNVPQTTSSSTFDGPFPQPPPSLPPMGDPLRDLSLSELLERNDWILSVTSNQ